MSVKWKMNLRLLAGVLTCLAVLFVAIGSITLLEEYLLLILSLLFTICLLIPFDFKIIRSLKCFLFITYFTLGTFMMFNASKDGIVIGLAFFWFFIFTLGLESKNRESLLYEVYLAALLLMVPLISFRAVYKGGDVTYFAGNEYFTSVAMIIGSMLAFLGILISPFDSQARDVESQAKDKSINWFSTLVNLVSHNLRSPLATILGNAQLLETKYPSIYQSKELERIQNSVMTSNLIIDRLLKASFVTDRLSTLTLEESLANSYPELVISGTLDELSYEHNVSIHLSLEVFLDNAFRYSPERVDITMKGTRIEIRDYGKGLTQEQLESFGRLKGNTLGTLHGIGIPFALRILESIGYSVRAESCSPGLLIVIDQGLEFKDAEFRPIFEFVREKQIS